MAEKILILAKSGSGKSTSIRNLDPKTTMVIQPKKKRLPFPHKDWKKWDKESSTGSIFQINTFSGIKAVLTKMEQVGKKTIIIDDFVYVLADRVMADVDITGFSYKQIAA